MLLLRWHEDRGRSRLLCAERLQLWAQQPETQALLNRVLRGPLLLGCPAAIGLGAQQHMMQAL